MYCPKLVRKSMTSDSRVKNHVLSISEECIIFVLQLWALKKKVILVYSSKAQLNLCPSSPRWQEFTHFLLSPTSHSTSWHEKGLLSLVQHGCHWNAQGPENVRSILYCCCSVAQLFPTPCNPMDCSPWGSYDSPGKNTGVGCHALHQGIFPTQGSSPGLLHWRWILYGLSHQGSPTILEWVAYPSSRGSSQPRDRTQVSRIVGGFFTIWATRKSKNIGVGNLSLLQRIFPAQELNQGFLQCRRILYQLSYQGSLHFILLLFIWLRRVLVVACVIFLVVCGLSSCGTWAPVVAACQLSFPVVCGILVPQPGIEPASPALEGRFLTTLPPGKSHWGPFLKPKVPCLKSFAVPKTHLLEFGTFTQCPHATLADEQRPLEALCRHAVWEFPFAGGTPFFFLGSYYLSLPFSPSPICKLQSTSPLPETSTPFNTKLPSPVRESHVIRCQNPACSLEEQKESIFPSFWIFPSTERKTQRHMSKNWPSMFLFSA